MKLVSLVTTVLVTLSVGCKKEEPKPTLTTSASASASVAASATVAAPKKPKIGTGDPAAESKLRAIQLPLPKGVTGATFKDVPGGQDGDRRSNLKNSKDDILLGVRFIDCRQTFLKNYIDKKPEDRGELGYCFDAPTGQLKGFDLIAPADAVQHAVRAGNIVVLASSGPSWVKESVKTADLDAFLEGIDFAEIAKL